MTSVNLHARGEGPALPLVLLPPFPLDARAWGRVVDRVDGRVFAVDPPGFGGASATGEPSLDAYAAALLEVLDAAGVDRFVVAGNSMGGYGAMALAESHPERLAGIALLGTKASADTEEARTNRLTAAAKADDGVPMAELTAPMQQALVSESTWASDAGAVEALRGWLAEAPPNGFAWAQRAMAARPDRLSALAALSIPAVVLHGSEDAFMGPETQEPMARALGIDVTTIQGAGHLLPLEAADAVAAALRRLVDQASGE